MFENRHFDYEPILPDVDKFKPITIEAAAKSYSISTYRIKYWIDEGKIAIFKHSDIVNEYDIIEAIRWEMIIKRPREATEEEINAKQKSRKKQQLVDIFIIIVIFVMLGFIAYRTFFGGN